MLHILALCNCETFLSVFLQNVQDRIPFQVDKTYSFTSVVFKNVEPERKLLAVIQLKSLSITKQLDSLFTMEWKVMEAVIFYVCCIHTLTGWS